MEFDDNQYQKFVYLKISKYVNCVSAKFEKLFSGILTNIVQRNTKQQKRKEILYKKTKVKKQKLRHICNWYVKSSDSHAVAT